MLYRFGLAVNTGRRQGFTSSCDLGWDRSWAKAYFCRRCCVPEARHGPRTCAAVSTWRMVITLMRPGTGSPRGRRRRARHGGAAAVAGRRRRSVARPGGRRAVPMRWPSARRRRRGNSSSRSWPLHGHPHLWRHRLGEDIGLHAPVARQLLGWQAEDSRSASSASCWSSMETSASRCAAFSTTGSAALLGRGRSTCSIDGSREPAKACATVTSRRARIPT